MYNVLYLYLFNMEKWYVVLGIGTRAQNYTIEGVLK